MKLKIVFTVAAAFGALALSPAAQAAVIDVGPQTDTFVGDTRGYWFTAPVDFYMTGLFVPADATNVEQNIAVVKLGAVPPIYPTTTNDFSTLVIFRGVESEGLIPTSIQFLAGDRVGVLGSRGIINSYGEGNYASSIGGNPVTLARLGYQWDLASTDPQDLWTEDGRISRVWFTYEVGLIPGGVPEPASWAMLIAGFGLTGATMRRRRTAVAA